MLRGSDGATLLRGRRVSGCGVGASLDLARASVIAARRVPPVHRRRAGPFHAELSRRSSLPSAKQPPFAQVAPPLVLRAPSSSGSKGSGFSPTTGARTRSGFGAGTGTSELVALAALLEKRARRSGVFARGSSLHPASDLGARETSPPTGNDGHPSRIATARDRPDARPSLRAHGESARGGVQSATLPWKPSPWSSHGMPSKWTEPAAPNR